MATRKESYTAELPADREKMLGKRLRLIKQRHRKLILRPRDSLLRNLMDDEDCFDESEDCKELQVLETYGLELDSLA